MRRAVEWFLYLRSEDPQAAHHLIEERHWRPQPNDPALVQEPIGPELYGAAATAEEGLWSRSGWGGKGWVIGQNVCTERPWIVDLTLM